MDNALGRGGATVRVKVGVGRAILMSPRYGEGFGVVSVGGKSGFMPRYERIQAVRKMSPWMREKTAPAKKETCTEAGSHHVKSRESTGRPYMRPLCIKGETAIWPFSPPFCCDVLVYIQLRSR